MKAHSNLLCVSLLAILVSHSFAQQSQSGSQNSTNNSNLAEHVKSTPSFQQAQSQAGSTTVSVPPVSVSSSTVSGVSVSSPTASGYSVQTSSTTTSSPATSSGTTSNSNAQNSKTDNSKTQKSTTANPHQ